MSRPLRPPLSKEKRRETSICLFSHDEAPYVIEDALKNAGYRVVGSNAAASPHYNAAVMPESFDLIVMELNLLYTRGNTSLKIMRTNYPTIPIVVLHIDRTARGIASVYRWGARGYVYKNKEDFSELIHAVDVVVCGHVYTPPEYAQDVVTYLVDYQSHNSLSRDLGESEYKIVAYLYQGWPIEKIADRLGINIKSTRTMISRIKKKLDMTDHRLWQLYLNAEYPDSINDLVKVQF